MVEFIHKLTGTRMWVDETRKDEYIAAGYKLAADDSKPIKNKPTEAKGKKA